MNESIKNLLERRSIRAYKKELVRKELWIRSWKQENIPPAAWDSRALLW